jgi:hypothetical protein
MVQRLALDDWPPSRPSRGHRIHAAYLRATRRTGVRKVAYIVAATGPVPEMPNPARAIRRRPLALR